MLGQVEVPVDGHSCLCLSRTPLPFAQVTAGFCFRGGVYLSHEGGKSTVSSAHPGDCTLLNPKCHPPLLADLLPRYGTSFSLPCCLLCYCLLRNLSIRGKQS